MSSGVEYRKYVPVLDNEEPRSPITVHAMLIRPLPHTKVDQSSVRYR